jgi:hypothetical protein
LIFRALFVEYARFFSESLQARHTGIFSDFVKVVGMRRHVTRGGVAQRSATKPARCVEEADDSI